jgi:hypothetical protein
MEGRVPAGRSLRSTPPSAVESKLPARESFQATWLHLRSRSGNVAEHSLNARCPLRDRPCCVVQRRHGETLPHFREFSGFVVIVVLGSISSAPSAQHTRTPIGSQETRNGVVWFAESSIRPPVSRPRGPVPADRHPSRHRASRSGREIHIAAGLALSTLASGAGSSGCRLCCCAKAAVWRMKNRTYAPGTYLAETTFF